MFTTLARLLSRAPKATRPAARTARLGLDAMETRDAPAVLNSPLAVRAFDPQPEPPGGHVVVVRTISTIPGTYVPGPGD